MADRQPFSERRYTDSELAQILDEASKSEARADVVPTASEGFTLEEIRDIAREAGIDPSHVDRAAAGLLASQDPPRPAAGRFTLSRLVHEELVTTVHEELVVSRSLSDDEMLSLVHHLESVVPWSGMVRQAGSWVEWRDAKDRLYMGVVRGKDQTRIRLIANQNGELQAGAGILGFASMLAMGAFGSFYALLPIGAVALGAASIYWKSRTRTTRAHLRELLQILTRFV
jgi:hypothetical protein